MKNLLKNKINIKNLFIKKYLKIIYIYIIYTIVYIVYWVLYYESNIETYYRSSVVEC
jgi:hypothetical protein